jgi:hypothetical protein
LSWRSPGRRVSYLADVAVLCHHGARCRSRARRAKLRLARPAELAPRLHVEAERIGERVTTEIAALLADGVAPHLACTDAARVVRKPKRRKNMGE